MKTINRNEALALIKSHGQSLFGVKFIKENGELRSMSCKLHASNKAVELNKTGRKQSPNQNPYMVRVFDMNKPTEDGRGAFRTINVQNLIELSINNEKYEVVKTYTHILDFFSILNS